MPEDLDREKLALERRKFGLDRWKTAFSLLTPLVLVALTFQVQSVLQDREARIRTGEQILSEKQRLYDELGRYLNIIYVYVADVGDYSQYEPPEVIQLKRDSDRLFNMYLPYWSEETEAKYAVFMDAAFDTYTGSGLPARIRARSFEKKAAAQNSQAAWQPEWDPHFTEERDPGYRSAYYDLVGALLGDIATPEIHGR